MLGTAGIGLTRGRSRDPFGLSTAELGESYLERVIEAKPEWVLLRSTLMQLRQSKRKTASRTATGNIPREDRWEAVSDLPDTERFAFLLDEVEQEYSRVDSDYGYLKAIRGPDTEPTTESGIRRHATPKSCWH